VVDGNARVEGPEFETIALCGSSIGNGSRKKLVEMNALCDDLGLDTISTGGVIACMMELTEKGIHDFGIRFGDADSALDLVRDIALRRGRGDEAAGGSKVLAEKYGSPGTSMQIKGMELPGYDPRGSWGMGIAYVTAPRGGCHMSAYPIAAEAWGELDPFTFEGKARLVADMQNAQFAKFSMGICDFWPVESGTLGRMFEVTFGGDWPADKVDTAGERIFNLQRMYNVMAGFTDEEDTLPARFYTELLPDGPPSDKAMTKKPLPRASGSTTRIGAGTKRAGLFRISSGNWGSKRSWWRDTSRQSGGNETAPDLGRQPEHPAGLSPAAVMLHQPGPDDLIDGDVQFCRLLEIISPHAGIKHLRRENSGKPYLPVYEHLCEKECRLAGKIRLMSYPRLVIRFT